MGCFNVADIVTGESIQAGDPCVGIMVRTPLEEFPLSRNPNVASLRPFDRFRAESLPVVGRYDDYGGLELDRGDENQAAVRIALAMTGCRNWQELSERAFDHRAGVQLLGLADGTRHRAINSNGSLRRVYGLALMRQENFTALCGTKAEEAAAQVAQMMPLAEETDAMARELRMYERAAGETLPAEAMRTLRRWMSRQSLLRPGNSETMMRGDDDVYVAAPALATALSPDIYGDDLLTALRASEALSPGSESFDRGAYATMLAAAWQMRCAERGMDELGVEMRPSMILGQRSNRLELLASALQRIDRYFASEVSDCVDYGNEESAAQLRGLASTLDSITARIKAGLPRLDEVDRAPTRSVVSASKKL